MAPGIKSKNIKYTCNTSLFLYVINNCLLVFKSIWSMSSFFFCCIVRHNFRCSLLDIGLEHCWHWDANQKGCFKPVYFKKWWQFEVWTHTSKENLVGNRMPPSKWGASKLWYTKDCSSYWAFPSDAANTGTQPP